MAVSIIAIVNETSAQEARKSKWLQYTFRARVARYIKHAAQS